MSDVPVAAETHDVPSPPIPPPPPEEGEQVEKPVPEPTGEDVGTGKSSGDKWKLHEMGRKIFGDVESTDKVKEKFKPAIALIAIDIRAHREAGGALSEEQKTFLELYEKDPTGELMLSTEAGAIAAHTMMETMLFVNLIALGRNITLDNKGLKPDDPRLKLQLKGEEYEGFIRRYQREGHAILEKLFGPLSKNPFQENPEINLSLLAGVDINRLPPEYREYIDRAKLPVAESDVCRLVLQVAEAQIEFYKALQVPIHNLNSLTPWGELRLTEDEARVLRPGQIAQKFAAEWNTFRLNAFDDLGGFSKTLKAGDKVEIFFEAQRKTVAEFTSRRLKELSTGEKGIQAPIIETLQRRKEEVTSEDAKRKRVAALDKERSKKALQKTDEEAELKTKKMEREEIEKKVISLSQRKGNLESKRDRLQPVVDDLEERKRTEEGLLRQATANYEAQITNAQSRDQVNLLKAQWESAERRYQTQMAVITKGDKGLDVQREELNKAKEELESEGTLNAQKQYFDKRIKELTDSIDNFETRLDEIEEELRVGITAADKEKIARFEVAMQALGRYDEVFTTFTDAKKRGKYTISELADTKPDDKLVQIGISVPKGYAEIIRLVFDPLNRPGKIDIVEFWKQAMQVLPPKELAFILQAEFGIQANAGPDLLINVFTQMKTRRITPVRLHQTFFNIFKEISDNALSI